MLMLRSMIFVPGFKLPFLEKSQALESDALIFDLKTRFRRPLKVRRGLTLETY